MMHPPSSVVTLPATIITATVAGAPGHAPIHPTGVQVPAPTPMPPSDQPQTFVPPSSVAQVQLIGPPPGINQVQYQIHPNQPLQLQGIPPLPPASQNSQMYVVSQPPPPRSINGGVSYMYTQPRPTSPTQSLIEHVNVNLQQPPPSGEFNILFKKKKIFNNLNVESSLV